MFSSKQEISLMNVKKARTILLFLNINTQFLLKFNYVFLEY